MNLPNLLTIFRIILIPFFLVSLLSDLPYGAIIATFIFIVASITDALDGYIARKHNLITNFGKIMDPLADKLLVLAALVALVELGIIPAWITILILGREFAITGLRSVAAAEGVVVAASSLGKYKTISQMLALILLLLDPYIKAWAGFSIGMTILYIALFFTLYSGYDYIRMFSKEIKWS